MVRRNLRNCWLALLLMSTMFVSSVIERPVLAEFPPSAYERFRANAPEVVKIVVLKVKTKELPKRLGVEVQAQVLEVQRSKSRLMPKSTIRIVYEIDRRGIPGPRPLPLLKEKITYTAFLQKDGKIFKPAALAGSFDAATTIDR
jgi:hypothetical protein